MSGMVRQKHLFWWSLHRDKNRWKEQHFTRTHLKTPGNWSRLVEQFWNENVGARRNPRMHRCLCGDWGEVKEKTMDKSSTSPLGQFRDFLMRVCMSVSGPADVYFQMRRHYIRISGGRGLKGVPRAMPTLPYLTLWSYLLFLRTICTLIELACTHSGGCAGETGNKLHLKRTKKEKRNVNSEPKKTFSSKF